MTTNTTTSARADDLQAMADHFDLAAKNAPTRYLGDLYDHFRAVLRAELASLRSSRTESGGGSATVDAIVQQNGFVLVRAMHLAEAGLALAYVDSIPPKSRHAPVTERAAWTPTPEALTNDAALTEVAKRAREALASRAERAERGGTGVNRTTIRVEVLRALFEYAMKNEQFPIDEHFNNYLREIIEALRTPPPEGPKCWTCAGSKVMTRDSEDGPIRMTCDECQCVCNDTWQGPAFCKQHDGDCQPSALLNSSHGGGR